MRQRRPSRGCQVLDGQARVAQAYTLKRHVLKKSMQQFPLVFLSCDNLI